MQLSQRTIPSRILAIALLVLPLAVLLVTAADQPLPSSQNWSLFRGTPLAQGVSKESITAPLKVEWKFNVKNGAFEATAAIVDNVVYIGDLDGTLFALDLASGKKR